MLSVGMRIRVKLLKKLLPGYAFFFGSLAVIGVAYYLIAGSPVGLSALFVCFVALRYQYKDSITYHNKSTRICLLLSDALFAVSAFPLIILNMRISLLSCVPIAIGMTWLLYAIGKKDLYEDRLLELTRPKKFDIDTCTEQELVARCKERITRDLEYKTERAIKHFILKLPHEQIDVNVEQSKKERYRLRKLLK